MLSRQPVLAIEAIRLTESAADATDAIYRCADVLEEIGAVDPAYRASMLERERLMSTFLGEGVAIPHGLDTSRSLVRRDALAVLRFPGGVPWPGGQVTVCVAIAAQADGHVALLSRLASILLDPPSARELREATDPHAVIRLLEEER